MSFLYAIQCGTYAIKFGVARDIKKRLCGLQNATFLPLEVIASIKIPGNYFRFENAVHKALRNHRIRGEWFRINEDTLAMVGLMTAGDIDGIKNKVTDHMRAQWIRDLPEEPEPPEDFMKILGCDFGA